MAEPGKAEPGKKSYGVDHSSEQEKLRRWKLTLQEIRRQLIPPADRQKINRQDINTFASNLGKVFAEVESLRNSPDKTKYLRSVDGASKKIMKAIDALNVAEQILKKVNSRSISMKDLAQGWREFYAELDTCQNALNEALSLFK